MSALYTHTVQSNVTFSFLYDMTLNHEDYKVRTAVKRLIKSCLEHGFEESDGLSFSLAVNDNNKNDRRVYINNKEKSWELCYKVHSNKFMSFLQSMTSL